MQKLPQAKDLLVRNPGNDLGGSISIRKHKRSQPVLKEVSLKWQGGAKTLSWTCGRPVFLSPPVPSTAGPILGTNSKTNFKFAVHFIKPGSRLLESTLLCVCFRFFFLIAKP